MLEIKEKTKDRIYTFVKKDLEPSFLSVAAKVLFAFGVGGLFSMLLCGQFGLGLSQNAIQWHYAIHNRVGSLLCSIISGTIFMLLPVLILRVLCSGLLFRKIVREYNLPQVVLISTIGFTLCKMGAVMTQGIYAALWSLGAYAAYKALGSLLGRYSMSVSPFKSRT